MSAGGCVCDDQAVEQDNVKSRASRRSDGDAVDDGVTPWRTEGLPKKRRWQPPEWWRTWRWVVLAVLLLLNIWVVNVLLAPEDHRVTVSYNVFVDQLEAGDVERIFTRGFTIEGTFKRPVRVPDSPDPVSEFATTRPAFANDDLVSQLLEQGVTVNAAPAKPQRSLLLSLVLSVLPVLIFVGLYVVLFRSLFARSGLTLGRSRARLYDPDTAPRVTFDDVAGIDEVKDELRELVDMLRDPGRYRRLGASIPRGVLLEGAPGTGKTLLARAVAGEANVPFFSSSASEFIEMVVGVGASRVRGLFAEARKVAPAIVFIDEIDAVGRARGRAGPGGGVDEREQTLNQILTEMDGFSGFEGVIVIAATNRIDVLDPALLRPGRFDRRVTVGAPDKRGRREILAVHARDTPLDDGVDLDRLAAITPGMVGADLANLINEAALLAARRGREDVAMNDFRDALDKVLLGAARHLVMPEDERVRTAYHEAGHAMVGLLVPGADPVRKVSIVPRGMALGMTYQSPDEDRYGYTVTQLRARLIGLLGGRAAEEIVIGDVSTGAESDLDRVAMIGRMMVGRWGMSPAIGPLAVLPRDEGYPGLNGRLPSEEVRQRVDAEVRRIVDDSYRDALALLREHRDKLDALASALLEHETLDEEGIHAAVGLGLPVAR
jgi:cell division protease FtsH